MAGATKGFRLVDPPGGQRVHVHFHGTFAGRVIEWHGELMTLRYCCTQCERRSLRPFIEIGPETVQGRRVRVGLDVAEIDEPTVAKAVIMVRNYRRLREGLIEFGESVDCAPAGGDAQGPAPADDSA